MDLIEEMILEGNSLQDLKTNNLYKRNRKKLNEILTQEFNAQKRQSKYRDRKWIEVIEILEDNEKIDSRTRKIIRTYCENENFRRGVLANLYASEIINENKYMLIFLCNRMKRLGKIRITEYNKQYLERTIEELKEKIKKEDLLKQAQLEKNIQEDYNQNTTNTVIEEKKDTPFKVKSKEDIYIESIDDTISKMKQRAQDFKDKMGTLKTGEETEETLPTAMPKEDISAERIDDTISKMKKRAKDFRKTIHVNIYQEPDVDDEIKKIKENAKKYKRDYPNMEQK